MRLSIERPWLRRVVSSVNYFYSCLFQDFSYNRLLGTFSWFHEAGNGGVTCLRPLRLAAEQGACSILNQHDDGRVGAWKLLAKTVLGGAPHDVTSVLRFVKCAATATVTVCSLPVHHGSCVTEKRTIGVRQQGCELTQVTKQVTCGVRR